MTSKSIEIGNKKYTVNLDVSSMNHLCTFREISNFKLTVQKHDRRFNSYKTDETPLTEDETNLVSSLFASVIDLYSISHDVKGFIATLSTGNTFRWDYTQVQKKHFKPIFDVIGSDSHMVLYKEVKTYGNVEENLPSDTTKYCELTLFNFNRNRIEEMAGNLDTYKQVLVSQLPEEEDQPSSDGVLTEAMIREYLNQGN